MFSPDYNEELMVKCMMRSETLRNPCLLKPENIPMTILRLIKKYNGVIFGSVMTAFMLGSPRMNGTPARDLDILFRNEDDNKNFSVELNAYFKSLKNIGYVNQHVMLYRHLYHFNDITRPESPCADYINVAWWTETRYFQSLNVHTTCLSKSVEEKIRTDPVSYVRYLFDHFFKYDFTKCVLYRGTVFTKLKDIREARIEVGDISDDSYRKLVRKYTKRGIKFLIDNDESLKVSVSQVSEVQSKTEDEDSESEDEGSDAASVERVLIRMGEFMTNDQCERIKSQIESGVSFEIKNDEPESDCVEIDRDALKKAKDRYRSLGLVVIPLSTRDLDGAGKCPAVAGWTEKTKDYNFDTNRCDNIGIVCGKESGIVCIDVDSKDGGMHYFDKMIEKYGLPRCPTQMTPNGGRHYIFKYNCDRMSEMKAKIKALSIGDVRIGVDLWMDKCQFVAEPSVNRVVNRGYKWTVPFDSMDDVPELPEWIYQLYDNGEITEDGVMVGKKVESVPDQGKESITDEKTSYRIETMMMMALVAFMFLMMCMSMVVIVLMMIAVVFKLSSENQRQTIIAGITKMFCFRRLI